MLTKSERQLLQRVLIGYFLVNSIHNPRVLNGSIKTPHELLRYLKNHESLIRSGVLRMSDKQLLNEIITSKTNSSL